MHLEHTDETLFIIQKFTAQPWQIGLMTMLVGVSIAVVQALFVQKLVKRFGEVVVASFCMLLQMAGALTMCFNPIFLLVYPITFLRSAASGFIFPTLGTLSAKRVSYDQQGLLMGVTTALNSLMGIISPILAGLLYDHWAPGAPYWLASIFFVAAALLLRTQKLPSTNLEAAAS